MKWTVSTGPALEPVTLAEAKAHLRVDHNEEDSLIAGLITAARRKAEQETGRCLTAQTIKAYWDAWPASNTLELPLYPVYSVTSVKYLDETGTLQTWASANYTVDSIGMSCRIVLNPDADAPQAGKYPNAIQVEYVAGDSTAATVPQEIKQAILLGVGLLYEYRVDMKINDNTPGVRSMGWLLSGNRSNLI